MVDVGSPAAMFAQQVAFEHKIERATTRRMTEFLSRVEQLAFDAGPYLSPAVVETEWRALLSAVHDDLRDAGMTPFEVSYVVDRLLSSETPDLAYLAAMSVLEEWAARRESTSWLRAELASVFALDSDAITAAGFWDRAADKLTRGVIAGLGAAQNWKHKVEALSRTSATGLQAAAALQTMRAQRVVFKRWVTKRDGKVRLTHASTDGKTIRLNEAFLVGGFSLQHPGDVNAPPSETANCRCVLVSVR